MSNSVADSFVARFMRLRDAPRYLGMDRNRFNTEVRPYLIEIPIGKQGIAFDRIDLDNWADEYKSRNGRPGQPQGVRLWDARERQGLLSAMGAGISTNASTGGEFARALAQLSSKKQSAT